MNSYPFTHLHLHTEYSLLDGANKIPILAKQLKEKNMSSVAMTDHGNMFGAIDFYKTMKKEGIKPIVGMEGYIHNCEDISDKSTRARFHICLYAKNEIGYKNLMYLSSQSYTKGFYYFPRISKNLLKQHSEGLVASSACLQGEISWHLNTRNDRNVRFGAKGYERAKEVALEYREIFKDDFYIEIMRHGIEDQHFIDNQLIKISQETGIKLVATNDTHYPTQDYARAHEIFMCIAMNKSFNDPNRLKHSVQEFYLKTPEQMNEIFADIPQALISTQEIVDKCNLEIPLDNCLPPRFKFAKEYIENENAPCKDEREYFIYKCNQGLKERLKIVDEALHEQYKQRLKYEIDIIVKMNFAGYMLIVWDFVSYAREAKVPVGPGRGSAAGSLVAYSLFITDIDPIKYGLIFERFLNPNRVSMPDIDMDFCQQGRDKVINYVVKKYGRDNVAQIITFNSLLSKGVLRDTARVLDMPYQQADAMAKLIPDKLGVSLKESYEMEDKIQNLLESDNLSSDVWNTALKLEGLKRNAGIHAAGVVISDNPLWEKTPLYKPTGEEVLATQYSGKFIESVDLIKFDFLGLKTLTVIQKSIDLIQERYNKTIDFSTIDVDDPQVYEMIKDGNTLGMFQIESSGMQDLNSKIVSSCFEDLIAILALYRPGPMESGMVDTFIKRKHKREELSYFFDEFASVLEPVLKNTYGIILYQEQVMQIVQSIGGFSLGESDDIRRAMGKKDEVLMNELADEFVIRAVKKGYNKNNAQEMFNLIRKFAGYGFNKSHSAAYALITFQTAYLKTYYTAEFMSALLSSERDNSDKVGRYIDDLKRLKIKLLPPNINISDIDFSVDYSNEASVVFGLSAIKGVGEKALEPIVRNRKENGKFKSLQDLITRVGADINKKSLESLIKAGAFDCFEYNRNTLILNMENILDCMQRTKKLKDTSENSLFGLDDLGDVNIEIKKHKDISIKEKLAMEKETLGIYVSGHPLDSKREEIEKIEYVLSSSLKEHNDEEILMVGRVEEIHEKISKKGNKFAILDILDFHGNIETTAFERSVQELKAKDLSKPLAFSIHINSENRLLLKKIYSIKKAQQEFPKSNKAVNIQKNTINDNIVQPPQEDLETYKVIVKADTEPKKMKDIYEFLSHQDMIDDDDEQPNRVLEFVFIQGNQTIQSLKTKFNISQDAKEEIIKILQG